MAVKKIELEEVAALTKELFHAHYAGDLGAMVFLPLPGQRLPRHGRAVTIWRRRNQGTFQRLFWESHQHHTGRIFPAFFERQCVQVCGQIFLESLEKSFRIINRFTISYRIIGGELKMVHQHNTYEYMQPSESRILNLDMNTMQFVRSLLLDRPSGRRMPVRSGTQTIFVNPNTVLYVQSQRRKTEFVCIDRVISCNSSIGEIGMELPDFFYPLRRGYLVNTLFIVAIRRFEVELISGICIPIPALTYQQVKQDLLRKQSLPPLNLSDK